MNDSIAENNLLNLNKNWYALYTKPRHEFKAAEDLIERKKLRSH